MSVFQIGLILVAAAAATIGVLIYARYRRPLGNHHLHHVSQVRDLTDEEARR